MKKKKKTKNNKLIKKSSYLKIVIFIILALLIISIITMGIFSNKNKAKVIETKTFSEIPGFSFEYPVFEGWGSSKPQIKQNNKTGDITATIFLSYPTNMDFLIPPTVTIVKSNRMVKLDPKGYIFKKNNNGANYYYAEDQKTFGSVTFSSSDFLVDINTFAHERDGFSGKVLVDKIIETFKFTPTPESEGYILLTNLSAFPKKYQNATKVVIERLKQDKENPEDFFVKISEFEKSGLNGSLLTFELSHKDDFKPENINTIGNPSGKSRNIVYDTNQNKIIKSLLWK